MGRELQKRKRRSSRAKVTMPNRRKKALNPLGNDIIAKHWYVPPDAPFTRHHAVSMPEADHIARPGTRKKPCPKTTPASAWSPSWARLQAARLRPTNPPSMSPPTPSPHNPTTKASCRSAKSKSSATPRGALRASCATPTRSTTLSTTWTRTRSRSRSDSGSRRSRGATRSGPDSRRTARGPR